VIQACWQRERLRVLTGGSRFAAVERTARIVALNGYVFKSLSAKCIPTFAQIYPEQNVESGGKQGMIRKLKSGKYRLYSRKKDPKTGKRRNLGTFNSKEAAQKHERAVQFFKRH
jgi:hypothetical protein